MTSAFQTQRAQFANLTEHLGRRITAAAALTSLLALLISGRVTSYSGMELAARSDVQANIRVLLNSMDRFDIEAGALPDQLQALLSRRKLVYIYSFRDLQKINGNAVRGQLSLGAALRMMLDGTGCTYETFDNSLEVSCPSRRER